MLIDYIILAEFDIDKGSTVKLQYPHNVPNVNQEEIADHMIMDCAHNFGVVSSYFTLGRRSCKDLQSEQNRILQN